VSTLRRYATAAFLANLVVIALAFIALMQLFDLLSSGEEVVELHGRGIGVLAKHVVLKVPEIAVAAVPFSVLLAALLVLARLARNNEVMAMKAAGVSYYGLLMAFMPAAVLVAVFYFVLTDQLAPAAGRAYDAWDAEAKAVSDESQKPPAVKSGPGQWLRDGRSIVRFETALADGTRLLDVSVFVLDAKRNLLERITAPRAQYVDGTWRLEDAEQLRVDDPAGRGTTKLGQWVWDTALSPSQFADVASPTETLSTTDLLRFVTHPERGNRPPNVYETWLQKRLATPFAIFVMILLSAPVAQGFQRRGSLGLELSVGVGLGFLFFVVDGLLLALGEAGALPPAIAAWAPLALFACIGGATLVMLEGR
jgi:lipopolysaccharide export system permease protein